MVVYTVTQINNQAKLTIERNFNNIWVRGEITSKNYYPSGHTYFTIIDENSELSIVNFNSQNNNHVIKVGKKVILSGKLSLYSAKGRYQFIAQNIYPEGDGELWLKFEKLKKSLELEGLFNSDNKKVIPLHPKTIGIITSEKGAVLWDIIENFIVQGVKLNIKLFHSTVQGNSATTNIIKGIKTLNKLKVDIVILARGGGSIEDLWCFNNEKLVREIYSSQIPIISAIGHETDFTLSDFVADYRAPTPSYASELITRNFFETNQNIDNYYSEIHNKILNKFNYFKNILDSINLTNKIKLFKNKLELSQQNIAYLNSKIVNKFSYKLKTYINKLDYYENTININNPNYILGKGYLIANNLSGNQIQSIKSIQINENIKLQFKDGIVKSKILKIEENEK
jgi:exodeoxyribonuclease VII large subunit